MPLLEVDNLTRRFGGPARWVEERPEGYSDARKLISAVLLMAAKVE